MATPERDEKGKFITYAHGGYPLYYVMADSEVLCPDCANLPEAYTTSEKRAAARSGADREDPRDFTDREWEIVGVDIHYEGMPLICANCNKEIPSAYGPTDYDYKDMIRDWFGQIRGSEPNKSVIEKCLEFVKSKDTENEGNYHEVGKWVQEFIDENAGDVGRRIKINNPISYTEDRYGNYIVRHEATGKDIYIQTDYDFPSLASTFGWDGKLLPKTKTRAARIEDGDETGREIYSAINYLDKHVGKVVEDPGYFE